MNGIRLGYGKPAFWIGESEDDNYLHAFDGTPPRFYFDIFDKKLREQKPKLPEELEALQLDAKEARVAAVEFAILVSKIGRRAAIEEVKKRAEKK